MLRGNASNEMRQVALGQAFDCASPLYLHWLLPAAWNLSVVGRDPAGNVAAPQTYAWRVAYAQGAVYTRFLRCAALCCLGIQWLWRLDLPRPASGRLGLQLAACRLRN